MLLFKNLYHLFGFLLRSFLYRKRVTTIYKKFEKLCAERGVTAYRVAKDTGLSHTMFYSWKAGEYTPKVDKIMKIAEYFGVGLEYFYDED